jgi:short-subunit dehydrogenase involved in D-alanine esterification of teichoic acids
MVLLGWKKKISCQWTTPVFSQQQPMLIYDVIKELQNMPSNYTSFYCKTVSCQHLASLLLFDQANTFLICCIKEIMPL